MRQTPIFDTNIFGHVQDGSIAAKDWRFLARRPGHGWPLSSVTAVELLAGVQDERPDKFAQQREQVELACQLSKGHIHEQSRFLLCKEVLHVPFLLPPLPPKFLEDLMTVVRRARSLEELLSNRVPVKRLQTIGEGHAGLTGFKPSVFNEVVTDLKSEWKKGVERQASYIYPRWREHFQETGKRLPDMLEPPYASEVSFWDGTSNITAISGIPLDGKQLQVSFQTVGDPPSDGSSFQVQYGGTLDLITGPATIAYSQESFDTLRFPVTVLPCGVPPCQVTVAVGNAAMMSSPGTLTVNQ